MGRHVRVAKAERALKCALPRWQQQREPTSQLGSSSVGRPYVFRPRSLFGEALRRHELVPMLTDGRVFGAVGGPVAGSRAGRLRAILVSDGRADALLVVLGYALDATLAALDRRCVCVQLRCHMFVTITHKAPEAHALVFLVSAIASCGRNDRFAHCLLACADEALPASGSLGLACPGGSSSPRHISRSHACIPSSNSRAWRYLHQSMSTTLRRFDGSSDIVFISISASCSAGHASINCEKDRPVSLHC